MLEDVQDLLSCALSAAEAASSVLKQGYGTSFEIGTKINRHDLVTEYDKKSEEVILSAIRKKFPRHSFLSEESGSSPQKGSDITWVIDPLDGTLNFAHTVPMFSVSIAACKGEDVLCGVVAHPLLNEVFHATKGGGSFCNGKKISPSKTSDLDGAFLATGFPYNLKDNPNSCIEQFALIAKRGMPIRRIGSAAIDLCYVAAGRFDAYWEVKLMPWDLAAGQLILEEAGGKMSDYNGEPRPYTTHQAVLASNGLLHDQMVQILRPKPR